MPAVHFIYTPYIYNNCSLMQNISSLTYFFQYTVIKT